MHIIDAYMKQGQDPFIYRRGFLPLMPARPVGFPSTYRVGSPGGQISDADC